MNLLEIAINEEAKKEYSQAVQVYETIILNKNAPQASFINLAFLYWEFAAEFAFADAYNISESLRRIGGQRFQIVLEKGLLTYARNAEMHFWSRYFSHRLYFKEFTQVECIAIIEKYGDRESLVPYFFLYLFDKEKYKDKRDALLIECNDSPTAKNEYIRSILK
jgi:hypothetical protein